MKRAREEADDGDDGSARPGSFFEKLKRWREMEIKELFRLNKSVWQSCETANQIECLVIKTQQEISRCNELYATEHGSVLVFGSNDNSLLGFPVIEGKDTTIPAALPNVEYVRSVSVGGMHTAALTVHGDVYTWGVVDEGALGYEATPCPEGESPPDEGMPKKVPKLNDILQVKTGDSHTLFLNKKGQVLMCGMIRSSNDKQYHYPAEGKSCRGSNATPVPIKMPGNLKAVRIEAGNASNFAAAVLEDGSIVTFGKSVPW